MLIYTHNEFKSWLWAAWTLPRETCIKYHEIFKNINLTSVQNTQSATFMFRSRKRGKSFPMQTNYLHFSLYRPLSWTLLKRQTAWSGIEHKGVVAALRGQRWQTEPSVAGWGYNNTASLWVIFSSFSFFSFHSGCLSLWKPVRSNYRGFLVTAITIWLIIKSKEGIKTVLSELRRLAASSAGDRRTNDNPIGQTHSIKLCKCTNCRCTAGPPPHLTCANPLKRFQFQLSVPPQLLGCVSGNQRAAGDEKGVVGQLKYWAEHFNPHPPTTTPHYLAKREKKK